MLTLRAVVANNPRAQRAGSFARLRIVLDGDMLAMTPIANDAGPIAAWGDVPTGGWNDCDRAQNQTRCHCGVSVWKSLPAGWWRRCCRPR